jgi:hypothetical protein
MAKDWKLLYKESERTNKKLQHNNDELRRTNSELNIMDTQKLKKIILLQHKIYELEGGQIVRRKNKTNK